MTSTPGSTTQRAVIDYIANTDMVRTYYVCRIPGKPGEHVRWWNGCMFKSNDVNKWHPDDTKSNNIAYPVRLYTQGETLEIT